jgi:FtsP/CotA-like multicopper oxidase with cupredoxin domain
VRVGSLGALTGLALLLSCGRSATSLPRVQANDNRTPAGRLEHGVLHLDLEVRMARWHPEADDGAWIDVPVFAEKGKAAQVPGPLVRIPTGTSVELTLENRLDTAITVHGLLTRPAATFDSTPITAHERHTFRFAAGAPGTYLYWAALGPDDRHNERQQLAGAFVIDSAGPVAPDRVFVINIWSEKPDSHPYRNALAINGKAWPNSERLTYTTADSVRWRVVNASAREHPMHLHGFFFRLVGHGSALSDTLLPPADRPLEVTEMIAPRQTALLAWSPDRPGHWLFHCHLAFHVVPGFARLDTLPAPGHEHMAGLVLGIEVRPSPSWHDPERTDPRRLRLVIDERPMHGDSLRTIGVTIDGEGSTGSGQSPGPVLVLARNQPTDVTVVNHLAEPTAIHWHGLELESWSDGVVGMSGIGSMRAPPVMPGDSFVAHLTMPRAGTFIYHTHLHDVTQLTGGLYGPIVVLPPGQAWDPRRDHLFVLGWDGLAEGEILLVNGTRRGPPETMQAGVEHRLRFINIGPADPWPFALRRDSTLVTWRPVGRDGADLPPALTSPQPARQVLDVGNTFDASWTPAPGRYLLEIGEPGTPQYWSQVIVAR